MSCKIYIFVLFKLRTIWRIYLKDNPSQIMGYFGKAALIENGSKGRWWMQQFTQGKRSNIILKVSAGWAITLCTSLSFLPQRLWSKCRLPTPVLTDPASCRLHTDCKVKQKSCRSHSWKITKWISALLWTVRSTFWISATATKHFKNRCRL